MAVVFFVVLEALQSCDRPLAFAPVVVPPFPTEPAPVFVSLEVPPFPTDPAPVFVSLAAPLPELPFAFPEFVPDPELPLEPELLLPPLSPELLPPLLELAAIAEVTRPIENSDTANSFNIVSSWDCFYFATEQPQRPSDVPRMFSWYGIEQKKPRCRLGPER
jgi:hypothetical protein